MILIINTSGNGIDLVMGKKFAHMDAEKQAIQLPTFVEKFITDNGVKFSDLTAIGIVVGPGSFTGIRIGIAYAKGLSIGLKENVVKINAFEIYLAALETRQMAWPQTVGHKPFDLKLATEIVRKKLESGYEPAIPMYLRPSYAEEKNSGK